MGIFDGFLEARRRRLAERGAIRDELWAWAMDEHRIFTGLPDDDRTRLRELSGQFLATKRFYPVDGAEIDQKLKVSIAAQACLPLLGLDLSWYRDFSTIFVTPDAYAVTQRWTDESGILHEREETLAGESFSLGPIALSIPDIDASGWGEGYNVVIHEMSHKLDGLDGLYDGRPPLRAGMDPSRWNEAFTEAWEDLNAKLSDSPKARRAARRGTSKTRSRLDSYAAESPDEFFAVVCEYFWERPAVLAREYPAVHEQLKLFFRRDPSTWRK